LNNYHLSIVIPAYNEEIKIERDLSLAYAYLATQPFKSEVIVVDDGSSDETYEIVKSLEPYYKDLRGIRYDINRGKGYAVKIGVLQARGDHILFADAGACVPYIEMKKGLCLLQNGYDVALGSRALAESQVLKKQPLYRQFGSRAFGLVMRSIIEVNPIQDTQCGFKIFKREAANAIFNRNKIDGFMFDIEIILIAKKLGYRIKEFPVTWKNDPDTRFNPIRGSIRNLKELWKIKFVNRK